MLIPPFSSQQRGEIAVAALCDLANSFGRGIRSGDHDQGWIQKLQEEITQQLEGGLFGPLPNAMCNQAIDTARHAITPQILQAPSEPQTVALTARLNVFGRFLPSTTGDEDLPSLLHQAMIALRYTGDADTLHAVQCMAKHITGGLNRTGLSWRDGIEPEDIHRLCCNHLFTNSLLRKGWGELMKWAMQSKSVLNGEGPAAERIMAVVSDLESVRKRWTRFADEQVQALREELIQLASHETNFGCTFAHCRTFSLLGVQGCLKLCLSDNRVFNIEPVLEVDPLRPPPRKKGRRTMAVGSPIAS